MKNNKGKLSEKQKQIARKNLQDMKIKFEKKLKDNPNLRLEYSPEEIKLHREHYYLMKPYINAAILKCSNDERRGRNA